jgi:hypothetical protein
MDKLLNISDEELLNQANEASKNGDTTFFEKVISLGLKEKLFPSSSKYNIPYNLFSLACENKQIGMLKYFLTSPDWTESFNNFFILSENAREVCNMGDIDIIKYLFNEPKINDKNHLYGFILDAAVCYGKLNIIQYILENFSSNPAIQMSIINGKMLNTAAEYDNLDIIKYFFNNPEFSNHSHREINKEDLFKIAHKNDNLELIQYLIIDLNLKKNKAVKEALQKKPNDDVENMFKIRDLKQSLEKNLTTGDNHNSKKPKL